VQLCATAFRFTRGRIRGSGLGICLLLCSWLVAPGGLRAADLLPAFDQANRLYEQGQYTNAAIAYDKLIEAGHGSTTLYFNLGNAWFKAGQPGRAIAAYRHAERLAPRDPNVRFNLQFTRKQVTGGESRSRPIWQRYLQALTLNEWTVLAVCGWWLWFGLLALGEWKSDLRRALRGYTATAGGIAGVLVVSLGVALREASVARDAVVIVPTAVVRRGPLDESQVFYQLRDGSEVTVLDEKPGTAKDSWLQVRDEARRIGWLKRDQVVLLQPLASGAGSR
jgi:hypothetical protein